MKRRATQQCEAACTETELLNMAKSMMQVPVHGPKKEPAEDELWCATLSGPMSRLDTKEKMRCRRKIMDILFEAEFGPDT